MTTAHTLFFLAAASSLGLGLLGVARRPRGMLRWSFALGMAGFTLESAAAFVLVTQTDAPDERLFWLTTTLIAGLLLLVPWGLFVASLTQPSPSRVSRPLWLGLGFGIAVISAGAVAAGWFPAFEVADLNGAFYAARVGPVGRLAVLVQILAVVALLAGLEAVLRVARREARWRIKYLVLGLGGVFLVRFYFLSQVALFSVTMANYLITEAATSLVANLAIFASLMRDRLGAGLAVSRHVLYRSAVIGVLGVYLLAVGILGWLLNSLGIAEELFLGSVIIFVSALGLAAVLLSEAVRWRVKQFVARHFYRTKYDYREQWVTFTKRLGSLVMLDELAPQLLAAVVETVGTTVGVIYLRDDDQDGRYLAATSIGVGRPTEALHADQPMLASLKTTQTPVVLESGGLDPGLELEPRIARVFTHGSALIPLRWRGELTGFLLIGPERTGDTYSIEDLEFMATVGEQAAGAIVTARLSENLARSREFEAFHRLTSFVIHDLKNSISALSLLSDNALQNFDDPEFQRDAIKTVAKATDRMKALLSRLSAAPESAALRVEPVDLAALVLDAARPIVKYDRISLVKDLAPVTVSADPELLLRVIQNLVANAVQSIDGQGTVTLKTFEGPGNAVVSIADTGCGMSEEFIRKSLFAPFRSTKKGGWGIGLHQARGIVEAHGGTIDVSSQEGVGTTFAVTLPHADGGRQ